MAAASFSDLAAILEAALNLVKERKSGHDAAQSAASTAKQSYDAAVKAAQVAHQAYSGHVNEIMSGFAQVHQ